MNYLEENDIRPKEFLVGQSVAVQADIDYLLARRDAFQECVCPACGGSGSLCWEKKSFTYDKCDYCGTVFMNPRPSEVLLHDFYRNSQNYAYWNKHIFPASEKSRREQIFKPRVDRLEGIIERIGSRSESLLEIGAGFGTFCKEVQSRGLFKRVVALEMTPDLARTCRERGLEVIDQPIETCGVPEESFDVIAAYEVIEHIHNPGAFVDSIRRFLKNEGLLVLSCPNAEGFDVQTLGPVSDTIDHEHLNYFNPESITRLLASRGMQVQEITTPGLLDADIVRNKVMSGACSLDSVFLHHILITHWEEYGHAFQHFLANSGLSSHMWVVARKILKGVL